MARVTRTQLATRDLEEIGEHIARESQSRTVAIQFLDSIDQKIQLYATQPEMGERRPDLGPDVRQFSIGYYVVLYRPTAAGVELARVLHGSRNISSVWWRSEG